MKNKQPVYLYRSVFKDLLDDYINNPEAIPNLEGANFTQYKRLNPFPYEPNKRYLHFFDDRVHAKQYAEDTELELGKKTCVLIFKFDPELVEASRTDGKFITQRATGLLNKGEKTITLNEYIIPAEKYDPAVNFVGVLEKDTYKPEPNVFAVLPESEVEYYATNLDAAYGLEYQQEESVVSLLDPESLKFKERAIHLFESREQAKNYRKLIKKAGNRLNVVPFTIDKELLDCCFTFVSGCGSDYLVSAKKEYLMPISQMTTEHYYEESNKSQEKQISYNPDSYSYGWFF